MSDGRPPRPRVARAAGSLRVDDDETAWLDSDVPEGTRLCVIGHARGVVVAVDEERRPSPWLAGDLAAISVPELLTIVVGARHTGALDVWGLDGRRRLFFDGGSYTGAMSSHKEDRIGEVIWREGRISLDQLLIATQTLEKGKRIGRYLVELGYIEARELRGWLRKQATAVFLGACLEPEGDAFFHAGATHPNPVRFTAVETERLVDEALALWGEARRLSREVEPLDVLATPTVPMPAGARSEAQEGILQLAMSAKTPLTRAQLLEKAGLGRIHGLRALAGLLGGGYFHEVERGATTATTTTRPHRIERLSDAINEVMDALRTAGGGAGPVRQFLREPPEHLVEALRGIDLDEGLAGKELAYRARLSEGGVEATEAGLAILLDFALFEANDTLTDEVVKALQARMQELDVF